jgi:toxin ParE1/3/4
VNRSYIFSPAADRDVEEQFDYLAERSLETAVRFLRAVDATCDALGRMPELGERQSFGRERLLVLRAWQVRGFENYVVFYRPIQNGIEVVRVLHAARDIAAIFAEES